MRFEVDLHCHTFFSEDGVADPEEVIGEARARGLHGIAVTDHDTCKAVDLLVAKGLMRLDGEPVDGFLVIPGVEVTTAAGHLLCLGSTLPRMKGQAVADVVRAIHDRGGLAVPAHPYDFFRAGIREQVLDGLEIDAIEVFNAAATLKRFNRKAAEYAKRRGLPGMAASDAHHADAVGTARTVFDVEVLNAREVMAALKEGRTELRPGYLSVWGSFRKTFANAFRGRKGRGREG